MTRAKKITALAILGVMIAAVFVAPVGVSGASNEVRSIRGGVLTGALKGDIPSSDPTKVSDDTSWAILDLVYDSLGHTDPKSGKVYPLLAESWEVSPNDPNSLIVKLRKGVKFHDGSSLDADDVVATYSNSDLQANPRFAKGFPAGMTVTKQDEFTVVFNFTEKAGRVYAHTFSVPILPDGKAIGAGTGPYKIESWTPGSGATLAAFDGAYFTPNLEKIVYKVVKPSGNESVDCAAGKGMVNGEYDFTTWFVNPADMSCFKDDNVRVTQEFGKEFVFVAFNSGKPYIGKPEFRKGSALSLMKQFIVVTVLANSVLMSSSVISPKNTEWYVPNLPNYYMIDYNNDGKPDPTEFAPAVRVLDDGGYIDVNGDGYRDMPGSVWNTTTGKFDQGGTMVLTVSAPSADAAGDPQLSLIGTMLQETMTKLGMKVTLERIPTSDLVVKIRNMSYDIAILKSSFFGTDFTGIDPTFVYDLFHSKGEKNYFGYKDLDSDLDDMENLLIPSERMEKVKNVVYHVAENLPINVLYYLKSLNAYRIKTSEGKAILGLIDSPLVGVWSKESLISAHLESRGKLSIAVSPPESVSSGGSGDITVVLTDAYATPVEDGDITFTILSGGGSIPSSGKTDANGKVTVTYTAPEVLVPTDVAILVEGSALLAEDASTIIRMTITPPPLTMPRVLVEAASSTIKSGESTTITITVNDSVKNIPVEGAWVTLVAEKGVILNTTSGVTDSAGKMTVTVTGNSDTWKTSAKITAIVSKAGYLQASGETTIQVEANSNTGSQVINVPGFELLTTIAAIGLASLLFMWRKRK